MTTTASDSSSIPSEILNELLASFAAKARPISFRFQTTLATGQTKEPSKINWLEPATRALNCLSYQETPVRQNCPQARGGGNSPVDTP